MRNITIKREKRFVASLVAMKVYMEDQANAELMISGIPCREVGKIKNGGELTFEAPENAVKLFVIGDKLSKEFCSDVYQLEDGSEDVFLTGKNVFHPVLGNPFRFAGNDTPTSIKNRKKGSKIGWLIILIAAIIGAVIGSTAFPQTFTCDELSITLTNKHQKVDLDDFTACYGTKNSEVYIINEPFDDYPEFEPLSLTEYRDLFIKMNLIDDYKTGVEGDLLFVEYEGLAEDSDYYVIAYFYKTDDNFWVVQFAAKENVFDSLRDDFSKYAASVKHN